MRGQDRVVTQSRRIVLQAGASGARDWSTPDSDPEGASQTHPLQDAERIVARGRFVLTPGCALQLSAVVLPSGQTQIAIPALGTYDAGGAQGEIRLSLTWDDGGTPIVRDYSVALPVSDLEFGAVGSSRWDRVRPVISPVLVPESLAPTSTLSRWSQPTLIEAVLSYVGGARVVHCVLAEVPYAIAKEADDASDTWTSHVFGASPGGQGPLVDYPYQRLSETTPDGNPRGGTWHLSNVAGAQAMRLGPVILHWTSWDEDGEAVDAAEGAPRIATSSSLVSLANASLTSYDPDLEGWSAASGAYARRRKYNDPAGMPNNGVIPVVLSAYCRGSDGTTNAAGVIRLQSSPYEWVDLDVPSGGAAAWRTVRGFARVGLGPGDPARLQVFFRRTGGAGGISVWAVQVHHADRVADP